VKTKKITILKKNTLYLTHKSYNKKKALDLQKIQQSNRNHDKIKKYNETGVQLLTIKWKNIRKWTKRCDPKRIDSRM